MGLMQGFKSLFFGEEEIDMEEYAAYQPSQTKTEVAPQPQSRSEESMASYESAREPSRKVQSGEQIQETPRQQPRTSRQSAAYGGMQSERQQTREPARASGRTEQTRQAGRQPAERPYQNQGRRSVAGQYNMRDNRNYQQEERNMEMSAQSSIDLVLSRPNNFRDVNMIGDDINTGKTVILNLEKVRQEEATRIIDFLSGVAYANQAEFKMLANKTYAIVPVTVNFSGVDLVSELENNGYNF